MKRISLLVAIPILMSVMALAQQTRSTLTGRVTDTTGAIVPGAQVTITNTNTGAKTTVVSNNAGDYTVPFLTPGPYQVSVTSKGFKTFVHSGINLQTEQTVTENVALEAGAADQSITVSADAALVDTATASTGQVLTSEEVEDLPSNGRSPLGFARDEYGAVSKGKHSQSQTRPFDNSAADDFSLGGGNSASNELLLNGVPNMQDSSRLAGYSPQLDSVDAVRVDEFSSDASTGDTSGGTVNITTKGGTNQFHGSISEYYSGSRPLSAKPYFTPAGATVSSNHFSQFGGTIGGPITIPHVIKGRDKLFFFYSFEGYIGSLPSTLIGSVPTDAERTGDFSALLAVNPNTYQLYNPYTSVATVDPKTNAITYTRSPIPGNKFTNAGLTPNSIAQKYLAFFPEPNYNGISTKPDGTNNYFVNDPTHNNYKSNAARIDYNISQSNKIFGEAHRSTSFTSQANALNNIASGTNVEVLLWGGSLDDVQNFSPTLNLNTRLGFSRSANTSEPNSFGTDPGSLGFPSYIGSTSVLHAIPRLTFTDNGYAGIPSLSGTPGSEAYFDAIQFYASLNKTWGHHTIKIGPDIRLNKDSTFSPGNANGTYSFNTGANDFVTSGSSGTIQPFGSTFALLELGLPSGGSFDVNTRFQFNNWYTGMFIQDDWKVAPNFTVSLGLRIEHETPVTESNNRMTAGWNPNTVNAATASAIAAYAKAPSSLLPAAQFVATGGLTYVTDGNRHAYSTAAAYLGPRVGFAYSPDFSHGKTSIRMGFGIYDNPFNDYYSSQTYGYSQTTNMIVSNDNNQTVATTLSDPFPTGSNAIQQPTGSALGINTNLGNKIVYYAPVKVAYSERSSIDIQQQFGKNWLLDVGYINNHQVHQSYSNTVTNGAGGVPVQYLSQSRYYDYNLTATYNASIANPYKGTLVGPGATTSIGTSSTLPQSQLLWPYAEYSSVTQQLIPGASANYNALLVRLEKRMANGLQFNVNYTYSRNLGAQSQLNTGGALWYGETASDFPNSLHLTGIFVLPFGTGKRFLNTNSKVLNEFVGGWELTSIWSFDSGTPYSWGNVIYNGSWNNFQNNPHNAGGLAFNTGASETTNQFDRRTCVDDTKPCDNNPAHAAFNPNVQPNAYNNRTFPLFALRADVTNNWDFSALKNFPIFERAQIQARVDAFNAFNRTQFSQPNLTPTSSAFGTINGQQNTNRQLQGGVHIIF